MRFQPLEKLINLHEGYRRAFKIDSLSLLLLQQNEQRYLIEGHCPHQGHALAQATVDGTCIQCPLHQYRFDLVSGELISATKQACRNLRTFELVYEGNEVGLLMPD